MGKSKKKVMHSRKEEEQAKKVLLIIGVSALILVLVMQHLSEGAVVFFSLFWPVSSYITCILLRNCYNFD